MLTDNNVAGFVRAQGSKLVNGNGEPLIVRGVGLGSRFLPEDYIWKFPEQGDRPRRIEGMRWRTGPLQLENCTYH